MPFSALYSNGEQVIAKPAEGNEARHKSPTEGEPGASTEEPPITATLKGPRWGSAAVQSKP